MANPFRFTAIPIRDQICFLRFLRYKDHNNILEVLLCAFGLMPIFLLGKMICFYWFWVSNFFTCYLFFVLCLNPLQKFSYFYQQNSNDTLAKEHACNTKPS